MCIHPAHYIFTRKVYSNYCGPRQCESRERLCQCCGNEFLINTDGAGTKYCSTVCKSVGYHPEAKPKDVAFCAWCGAPNPSRNYQRRVNAVWPYICQRCLEPIKHVVPQLKKHHVSHERVHVLVTNPSCEICGRNLLELTTRRGNSQKLVPSLVVDHDHSCCPGTSCGSCVRGLICHNCNWAAGAVNDDPGVALQLSTYLQIHQNK